MNNIKRLERKMRTAIHNKYDFGRSGYKININFVLIYIEHNIYDAMFFMMQKRQQFCSLSLGGKHFHLGGK